MAVGGAQAGQALVERLQARRPEIEEAVLTRVYSVEDPGEVGDPQYVAGLRAAVGAAVDYGLGGIEAREPPSIPPELTAQARRAAHSGVGLDTVLRRYFAGYTLLGDYLLGEAENSSPLGGGALKRVLRSEAALFDRIVAAVADAYTVEAQGRMRTTDQRRAEHVKKLLAGEVIEVGELGYELQDWHLGIIAVDSTGPRALRELAAALNRRLLAVVPSESSVWAWFGGRRRIEAEDLVETIKQLLPVGAALAIGEPARGVAGWRLTHRQAAAALPVALRMGEGPVRYADVALLAASLQDEILAGSLHSLYLSPLSDERDGGETLRQTARAYFAAGRNVSAASAALGVSRHTVTSRLRMIEERIGRSPDECAAEIETALRLQELAVPS